MKRLYSAKQRTPFFITIIGTTLFSVTLSIAISLYSSFTLEQQAPVSFRESMGHSKHFEKVLCDNDPHWKQAENLYNKAIKQEFSEKSTRRVPPLFHLIWLGSPVPEQYYLLAQKIQLLHPEYIVRIWTDSSLANFTFRNKKAFDYAQNFGEKSDVLRYELLYKYGGIYLDGDFTLLQSLDIITRVCDFFTGVAYDRPFILYNGLIGCTKEHPIIKEALDSIILSGSLSDPDAIMNRTGPYHFTRSFLKHAGNTTLSGTTVAFPVTFFYPFPNYERHNKDPLVIQQFIKSHSYAVHLWDTRWLKKNTPVKTSFEEEWSSMQAIYKELASVEQAHPEKEQFCHAYWSTAKAEIKQLIESKPVKNFLAHPALVEAMVRTGRGPMQRYELLYLQTCLSPHTTEKLLGFHETDALPLNREISEFSCTTNTLGQLFYLARILETVPNKPITTLIEFGAGFGNFARITKLVIPAATIILIDFPELLALQYLYLRITLPDVPLRIHTKPDDSYTPGAIHLVPVHLVQNIKEKADIFVSNFALSEAPEPVQKHIGKKQFFNADLCYITGQLQGWGSRQFVDHTVLHTLIRSQYPQVFCQPFHVFAADPHQEVPSYELIAQ